MPEGPEVRRYADMLAEVLDGQQLVTVAARTRQAREWLEAHPGALEGTTVQRVRARGKHLVVQLDQEHYFHSHLMMWGRWQVLERPCEYEPQGTWQPDRRERARLLTTTHAAVLLSAPIFEIGHGDPYEQVEILRTLGPETLPYPDEPPFDARAWKRRCLLPENAGREVGEALLDQRLCCGLGNYLRAEILFACRPDPWRRLQDLKPGDWRCLSQQIPLLTQRAYEYGGATVPDADRHRMRTDATLVYQPNRDIGTRHWVFRRTNLPCLVCGEAVRQKRQVTGSIPASAAAEEAEEKTRIIYFCPHCQQTTVPLPPLRKKTEKKPRAAP